MDMDPAYFLSPPALASSNAHDKTGRSLDLPVRTIKHATKNPRLALSFDGAVSQHKYHVRL